MASAGEKALHAALKQQVFDPVYFLVGDDDFRKDARVRDVIAAAVEPSTRDFNLEVRHGAEITPDVMDSLLGTPPLLASRRVVVIRDVDRLKKDARAVLDRYLERPAPDTVVLLVAAAGAKADRLLAGRATTVEFAPLTADRVLKWIGHQATTVLGRRISDDAATLLLEAVGPDLAQLAVELEKLASYASGEIDEAAVSAVCGVRRGESVGALLDAIAARDADTALRLIAGVLQQPKTSAVSIVMSITTQTLALSYGVAAREAGASPRAMFNEYMGLLKETGAFPGRPWGEAVNAWTRHTDRWTAADLATALSTLLACDTALKDTRLSSDEQVIGSLVLALCAPGAARRAA